MTYSLLVLGTIAIYIALVVGAVALVRKAAKSPWWYRSILVLAVAWPVLDLTLPKIIIGRLCDTTGGTRIYQTAEASGFFIEGENGCGYTCWNALMQKDESNFAFVEAYATGSYLDALVDKAGTYRFTREEVGLPSCVYYQQWLERSNFPANMNYLKSFCVATLPIEDTQARFRIRVNRGEVRLAFGDYLHTYKIIEDIKSGNILAEDHFFRYVPEVLWSGIFGLSYRCDKHEYLDTRSVLRPML